MHATAAFSDFGGGEYSFLLLFLLLSRFLFASLVGFVFLLFVLYINKHKTNEHIHTHVQAININIQATTNIYCKTQDNKMYTKTK